METVLNFGQAVIYAVIAIAAMYGVKFGRKFLYIKNADHLIEEENNLSLAFRQAGIYIGLAIAMFGAVSGADQGFFKDILELGAYGILSAILLTASLEISNRVVLPRINNNDEVKKGNISVGLVEFGGCIATGLIALGAFSGTGPFWSSIVFFLMGQAALLIMIAIYEYITPFVVIKEVEKDNVAAGILLSAMQIAVAFIIYRSIEGDFVSWEADMLAFAKSAISGIVLIAVLFNKPIDKLFLPNTTVATEIERDKNAAALLVVSSVKVALAIIISGVVL
jgi:uncharacterized membrane protein YjfL (UPF0719 family)